MALYKGFIPTISRQGPFTVVLFVTLEQHPQFFTHSLLPVLPLFTVPPSLSVIFQCFKDFLLSQLNSLKSCHIYRVDIWE
uniref:Uncharacterized protein n=1 Tax=Salix viminalis TaxID=40686 RepID=A0A6N2LT50_SALVM